MDLPIILSKISVNFYTVLKNVHSIYSKFILGVSAKDCTADSPDIIKSQMYGQYNFSASVPGAQVPAGYDQSSSNSHNGGSVNSQVESFFILFNVCIKLRLLTIIVLIFLLSG